MQNANEAFDWTRYYNDELYYNYPSTRDEIEQALFYVTHMLHKMHGPERRAAYAAMFPRTFEGPTPIQIATDKILAY